MNQNPLELMQTHTRYSRPAIFAVSRPEVVEARSPEYRRTASAETITGAFELMDLQKLANIPVINFGLEDLKPGTKSWFAACNSVRFALEEYGCFLAVYDRISSELREKIFIELEELFNFPMETKVQNTSDTPFFGYFGQNPELPLHESMGIGDATTLERIQNFSNLMWSDGNETFCETVHQYAKLLSELEQVVTGMVFESYGIEKHSNNRSNSMTYLLRFNKYRVPGRDETSIGSQIHTDKSFLTILDQNQVNGLEIKTKDDRWISVDFLPSSFVVMAGDGFLAWSNNRVQPAFHRVLMNGKETRYSLALFSYQKGIVQVPEELIDEENPRCFKPFDHLGLLNFFAKQVQMGRLSECWMKAYCGVN